MAPSVFRQTETMTNAQAALRIPSCRGFCLADSLPLRQKALLQQIWHELGPQAETNEVITYMSPNKEESQFGGDKIFHRTTTTTGFG